jgi:DNA-3-methyladenine glycosylase
MIDGNDAAPTDAAGLTPLPRAFYAPPVLQVARALVGKLLVHRSTDGLAAGRIVECEAYRGPEDLAAHSAGVRRTRRTEVMFGPPGYAYMFLLYGVHWAFNVVVGKIGDPHAVLIRAIEPYLGMSLMEARRGRPSSDVRLSNGPGKLCQALKLDRAAYGADLCGPVVFLATGNRRSPIVRSPRIGVEYSGAWAKKLWRFHEQGNPFVSVSPRP